MKFGVEFEVNYPLYSKSRRKGFCYYNDCYNEYEDDGYEIDIQQTLETFLHPIFPNWDFDVHHDGDADDNDYDALEFCTPPLTLGGQETKKSIAKLREVYKILKKMRAKGNYGCGIHIHISLSDDWLHKRDSLVDNFIRFVYPRQEIFYSIGDLDRRDDAFCQPIYYYDYGNGGDKYYGVNLHDGYPTIEFRYFPSLPDLDTLKTWIMLCAETVKIGYGKLHDQCDEKLSIDDMIKPYSKPLRKRLIKLMGRGKNPGKFYYSEVK